MENYYRKEMTMTPAIDIEEVKKQARTEVNDELHKKGVDALKQLYRKRELAKTALDNVDREIADFETRLAQGNA